MDETTENDIYTSELKSELQSERQQCEELRRLIKQLQRDHDSELATLNAQLLAEKERSTSLANSLQNQLGANPDIEQELTDLQLQDKFQKSEIEKLQKQLAGMSTQLEELKNLEANNFLLMERNKNLEEQLETVRESAISDIKEKERKLVELMAEKEGLEKDLEEAFDKLDNQEEEAEGTMTKRESLEWRDKVEDLTLQNDLLTKDHAKMESELTDIMTFIDKERTELKSHYAKEVESLQAHIEEVESKCDELKLDCRTLNGKLREAKAEKDDLLEEIQNIEEKSAALEQINHDYKLRIMDKDKTIHNLHSEITTVSEEVVTPEDYHSLEKRYNDVARKLAEHAKKSSAELAEKVAESVKLQEKAEDMEIKVKGLQKENKSLQEQCQALEESVENWKDSAKEANEKTVKVREEMQKEMAENVIKLKQEKFLLEEKIVEMQEQIEHERLSISIEQPSLMEELRMMDGQRSSRHSRVGMTPRVSSPDKNYESLRLDIIEKEFIIANLNTEKNKLVSEVEQITKRSFNLANSYNTAKQQKDGLEEELKKLREEFKSMEQLNTPRHHHRQNTEGSTQLFSENERLKADLIKAESELNSRIQIWDMESKSIRDALLNAEQQAIQAKIQFAEAATDRDIYLKQCKDLRKHLNSKPDPPPPQKQRLSIFKSKKNKQ